MTEALSAAIASGDRVRIYAPCPECVIASCWLPDSQPHRLRLAPRLDGLSPIRRGLQLAYHGVVHSDVPYTWLTIALESLRGIEPWEVNQALAAAGRWPRIAYGDTGVAVLTIWARIAAGRGLIVAVRPIGGLNWEIVGARAMRPDEEQTFDKWEATR